MELEPAAAPLCGAARGPTRPPQPTTGSPTAYGKGCRGGAEGTDATGLGQGVPCCGPLPLRTAVREHEEEQERERDAQWLYDGAYCMYAAGEVGEAWVCGRGLLWTRSGLMPPDEAKVVLSAVILLPVLTACSGTVHVANRGCGGTQACSRIQQKHALCCCRTCC